MSIHEKQMESWVGWMFQNHHLSAHGSGIWKKIREAWKNILEHVSILPPQDMCQVMSTHI
jgi:hypothetical protein